MATDGQPGPEAPSDQLHRHDRVVTYTSTNGLLLNVAVYGDSASPLVPVVCLPGLSRTSHDFHELAAHLSTDREGSRQVACFDFRGRGRSEWDADPANYNPVTEMEDVLDGMTTLGINRAVVIGTSRGGIVAMLIGVARPNVLAGVVLNDIGPTIEPLGLARIKSYVGRMPLPDDWDDAVSILRRLHGSHFPALSGADWTAWARATYHDEDGQPAQAYDPALARALDGIDFDRPMPSLWDEFRSLADLPCLVIRGENSDILSNETLEAMRAAHPRLLSLIVAGQGHPPQLRGPAVLDEIAGFVRTVEDAEQRQSSVETTGRDTEN